MISGDIDVAVYKIFKDGYVVRGMREEDVKQVQTWYTELNSNSVPVDDLYLAQSIFSGRPGCYIGEYQGKVVASCVRLDWGNKTYYGSMYYVAEEFRGRGFGTRLRDEVAYGHVREAGGIVCVDSVMGKVVENNTNKYGYKSSWVTTRYGGVAKDNWNSSFDGTIVHVSLLSIDLKPA